MGKRAKPEEIIAKLREAEVRLSQGESVGMAAKSIDNFNQRGRVFTRKLRFVHNANFARKPPAPAKPPPRPTRPTQAPSNGIETVSAGANAREVSSQTIAHPRHIDQTDRHDRLGAVSRRSELG